LLVFQFPKVSPNRRNGNIKFFSKVRDLYTFILIEQIDNHALTVSVQQEGSPHILILSLRSQQ